MSGKISRLWHWTGLSTTPEGNRPPETFRITHPFHPLYGREFVLVLYRHNWGEDRVFFHLTDDRLHSLPGAWTDVSPADPFVHIAAGRALFRYADLLVLARLLQELDQ